MEDKDIKNEKYTIINKLFKHFKCKKNHLAFYVGYPLTYNNYGDEKKCVVKKTTNAYCIEVFKDKTFEVSVRRGYVKSSDIDKEDLEKFANEVLYDDFYRQQLSELD